MPHPFPTRRASDLVYRLPACSKLCAVTSGMQRALQVTSVSQIFILCFWMKRLPNRRGYLHVSAISLTFDTCSTNGHSSIDSCSCATLSMRSEEHTSELQSLMRSSYAVFRLK